jgi:anti-sigma factor RsiW
MSAAPHLPDELLQRYVDDALSPAELEQTKSHLGECPACTLLAQEYRDLFGKLARLPVPPPPPRFTQAVMARVSAHRRDVARQRLVATATFATSLAAALLCFAGAGSHIWAHEVSAWSAQAIEAGRLLHVAFDVLGSLVAAVRLPLIVASAGLGVPLLLVLYRSLPERPLTASP